MYRPDHQAFLYDGGNNTPDINNATIRQAAEDARVTVYHLLMRVEKIITETSTYYVSSVNSIARQLRSLHGVFTVMQEMRGNNSPSGPSYRPKVRGYIKKTEAVCQHVVNRLCQIAPLTERWEILDEHHRYEIQVLESVLQKYKVDLLTKDSMIREAKNPVIKNGRLDCDALYVYLRIRYDIMERMKKLKTLINEKEDARARSSANGATSRRFDPEALKMPPIARVDTAHPQDDEVDKDDSKFDEEEFEGILDSMDIKNLRLHDAAKLFNYWLFLGDDFSKILACQLIWEERRDNGDKRILGSWLTEHERLRHFGP